MKEECAYNHNPNDIENSLEMLEKRTMEDPIIYYFICEECKQIFTFKRDKNGAFIEV